ncbi:hypothetical protein ABBQ38_004474 [Trebouxia sp. C0009 RCD-2024]
MLQKQSKDNIVRSEHDQASCVQPSLWVPPWVLSCIESHILKSIRSRCSRTVQTACVMPPQACLGVSLKVWLKDKIRWLNSTKAVMLHAIHRVITALWFRHVH